MKSGLGEINRGMVALLLVVAIAAGGYLWYSQMYKPAVLERTTAQGTADTAQQSLTTAKSDLQRAQDEYEKSRAEAGKPDDSVSRLQLATEAIPNKPLLDEVPLVLQTLADRTGIRTGFDAGSDTDTGGGAAEDGGATGSATPIDMKFMAVGSFGAMLNFIDQVEDTVTVQRGKLHARGRLFNVVGLQIVTADSSQTSGDGEETDLVPRTGEITFTVVIRMYVSATANSQAVGDAEANLDAAAAGATGEGTEGGTGTDTSGGAAGAEGATSETATFDSPDAAGGDSASSGAETGAEPAAAGTGGI